MAAAVPFASPSRRPCYRSSRARCSDSSTRPCAHCAKSFASLGGGGRFESSASPSFGGTGRLGLTASAPQNVAILSSRLSLLLWTQHEHELKLPTERTGVATQSF